MSWVVDTSVAVKWMVAEQGSEFAARLIGEDLIAPDLLLAEIGNAGWKKWLRKEIGKELAELMPAAARSFVRLLPSEPLAEKALEVALDLAHPVYDCYFLVLAELTERRLVTADGRLVKSCKGSRFECRIQLLEHGP